ncbi:uncharacterized protein [Euwallacea similis]|uniref:uncharacterized protein n=1 Tax=Euwallacea similis TaxID=1736056 RepID=UPI00344EF423
MWKFLITLVFAASAASQLQVTPEELRTHFDTIQNEMQQIQSYYIGYEYFLIWADFGEHLIHAKLNLTSKMLPHIQPYQDAMAEIFVKFTNEGTDVLECIQAVNEKLRNVSDDILTMTINNLTADVDQFLAKFYNYIITIDESFKELEEEVLACNDSTCATDLDATLDKLYAKVQDEEIAIDTKIKELVDEETEGLYFDKTNYDAQIQNLIDELQLCVK